MALTMRFTLLALALLATGVPRDAAAASPRFPGDGDMDRIPGAGDFTLEFHVRGTLAEDAVSVPDCGANGNRILGNVVVDRDHGESGGRDWGVSLGAGRVVFGVTNASFESATISGATRVLDGDWHHVAVQRCAADGLVRIWVDGVLDASGAGPPGDVSGPGDEGPSGTDCGGAPCFGSGPFLVLGAGVRDAGSSFPSFAAWIDELHVSRGLRYAAQFPPPSLPVAGEAEMEAYPNPALDQTLLWVRYGDGRAGEVSIDIRDVAGRRAVTLRGALRAGAAMLIWDGRGENGAPVRPGVYFARAAGAREAARIVRP